MMMSMKIRWLAVSVARAMPAAAAMTYHPTIVQSRLAHSAATHMTMLIHW